MGCVVKSIRKGIRTRLPCLLLEMDLVSGQMHQGRSIRPQERPGLGWAELRYPPPTYLLVQNWNCWWQRLEKTLVLRQLGKARPGQGAVAWTEVGHRRHRSPLPVQGQVK